MKVVEDKREGHNAKSKQVSSKRWKQSPRDPACLWFAFPLGVGGEEKESLKGDESNQCMCMMSLVLFLNKRFSKGGFVERMQ